MWLSWLLFLVTALFHIHQQNAQIQHRCGTNRWCTDIFPSMQSSASSHVSFNQSSSNIATNFTILFTPQGTNCFNPRLTLNFQRIDYDGAAEYLDIYDHDNELLARCEGWNSCDEFSTCIDDQRLNIDSIQVNHTYQIRVYQSSSVTALCHGLSIDVALDLFCAQHPSFAPTKAPIPATPSPTTQTTSPTRSTSSPTQDTVAPTTAPTAAPTIPTMLPTIRTNVPSIAPTSAPTPSPSAQTEAPTFGPTVPTLEPTLDSLAPTMTTFTPTKTPTTFTTEPTRTPTTPTIEPTSPTVTPTVQSIAPSLAPTMPTTFAPTGKSESALYSLQYIDGKNASCVNLVDNIGLKYNRNLTHCRDWCDSTIDCRLFNYFENLKMNHSRCYMFDHLCDIKMESGVFRSVVGYLDFEAQCTDYPSDWHDNVGDDCAGYESQNWCTNGSILRNENAFYPFEDVVYHLNALKPCCSCGGGIQNMDDVAFSIDNDWVDFESDILCTWVSDYITTNATRLREWDNLILYDMCTDLNMYSSNSTYGPCDALVDTLFDGDDYTLYLCTYTEQDRVNTMQFVMDLRITKESNGTAKHEFYVNTLWFNINASTSGYSPNINITHLSYSECVIDIVGINNTNNRTDVHRYGAHPCHLVGYNMTPTAHPVIQQTRSHNDSSSESYALNMHYLSHNERCIDLYENTGIKHSLNVSECSNWCDDTYDCVLFNYMDDLKGMNTSRCYIFDTLCSITFDHNIHKSVIGYYEFVESCIDYPHDWVDNVGDDCAYYESHNWCRDQNILRAEFEFYNLIDPIYNLQGRDACCECDGGAIVIDDVVLSVDYWVRIDLDVLCDWEHKDASQSQIKLRSWDNLVLYNMCLRLPDMNCDFLIDSRFNPPEYGYNLYICNYTTADTEGNEFMFDISLNTQSEAYDIYINTLWFTLDLSRYASIINVIHANYSFCFKDAADQTRHAMYHYGAHACYILDTLSPTVDPTFDPTSDPTLDPTFIPTFSPTFIPTFIPTVIPTFIPTFSPTLEPTVNPTVIPTFSPTLISTLNPTFAQARSTQGPGPWVTSTLISIVVSSILFVIFASLLFLVWKRVNKHEVALQKVEKHDKQLDEVVNNNVENHVQLANMLNRGLQMKLKSRSEEDDEKKSIESEDDEKKTQDHSMCILCLEATANMVNMTCGHKRYCHACVEKRPEMGASKSPKCTVCSKPVTYYLQSGKSKCLD